MKKTLEKRKEEVINWLKNPLNLSLVLVLVFAFAIRLYYFILTKNQPLWWDEAEYMSTAKSFAGLLNFDYTLSLNRLPGFPMLVSLFYMIGINNEVVLRFLLAFIPSMATIILMYFVLMSMYSDKKIAIISLAIFAVLWEHVFYSNRFHTENLSLIFEFLAILVLFNIYLKNKNWKFIKSRHSLFWIALFSIICIFFRSANMVFIPIVVLFLIIINFYKIPEKFRALSGGGLLALIIAGFISLSVLSKKYPFINQFYYSESPLGWKVFTLFYGFYESFIPLIPSILFYAFLIGIIVVIGRMAIFPEMFKKLSKKVEDNSSKADIFNLILIAGYLFFFIFMLRTNSFEYRWFFAILPAIFAFTAKGLIKVGDYAKSIFNSKSFSIFLIVLILLLGVYTQFNHTDLIVKAKVDSYSQVKDSGLWMKENSNKGDIIISASSMQHPYYSDRTTYNIDNFGDESNFTRFITENKPRYFVLSAFQSHPDWINIWVSENTNILTPIKAYYGDAQQQQVILIIYEFNVN